MKTHLQGLKTVKVFVLIKEKNAFSVLFSLVLTFSIVFLIYHSGLASFIRRMGELIIFRHTDSHHVNSINFISSSQNIPDKYPLYTNSDLYMANVVYIGFLKNKFWSWTLDGIILKLDLTHNSTYGIAVPLKNAAYACKSLKSLNEKGLVEIINPHPNFGGVIIESDRGNLDINNFRSIAKSGNLVKVVYNKRTGDLVGVVLIDFKCI